MLPAFFFVPFAGPRGFEPRSLVLETRILPLNYRPNRFENTREQSIFKEKAPSGAFSLFLNFFMFLLGFTPFAILFELDLSCDEFLVLAAPVVNALASAAGEFDQFVL